MLVLYIMRKFQTRFQNPQRGAWLRAISQPVLVFLSVLVFRIVEEIINPSALGRLFIGKGILLIVVLSVAWCVSDLVELFLAGLDARLDPRQRVVSHSLLYLARRGSKVVIVIFAVMLGLTNWGYQMNSIIAGLGVGSTRIRTLSRTVVSIPNNSFAGMNLENYSLRDKILFNPTLQIKRTTPKEQIRHSVIALEEMLKANKSLEVGPSPVRLSALAAASFALEIFAYVRTDDIDKFYKIEAELFLAIDDALTSSGVELV